MHALKNKTILLISPQSWGKMFISKHHYAIELAKMGNTVFYLNPPDDKKKRPSKKILIEQSPLHKNLFLIHHRLSFPYDIKFHFISLFHKLMKSHIRKLLRNIGKPIDIVWSFDLGNLYPFAFFPEHALKIFHPVDEPLNPVAIDSAKGAGIIFSVTTEILEKYKEYPVPKYCINHGVSEEFLQPRGMDQSAKNGTRVGFSGNLLRPDIDREALLRIIEENPAVVFECWGSYKTSESNIGGSENEGTKKFIQDLLSFKNIRLHGVVPTADLARAFREMDAFLVCYDVQKDQSKGTNYHKILEYISTGKVTIANNISTYGNRADLVQMVQQREHNHHLPELFKQVISHLDDFNNAANQEKRMAFARDNAYIRQLERIESILDVQNI